MSVAGNGLYGYQGPGSVTPECNTAMINVNNINVNNKVSMSKSNINTESSETCQQFISLST